MKKTIKLYIVGSFITLLTTYFVQRLFGATSTYEWYNRQENMKALESAFVGDLNIDYERTLNFWNVASLEDTINLQLLGWFILPLAVLSLPIILSKYCYSFKEVMIAIVSTAILLGLFYLSIILEWYGNIQDFDPLIIYSAFGYIYLPILAIETICLIIKCFPKKKT